MSIRSRSLGSVLIDDRGFDWALAACAAVALGIGVAVGAERPLVGVAGVALLCGAPVVLGRAAGALRDSLSLSRTPTLTADEAREQAGELDGPVAVRGTVRAGRERSFAPLGRRECVAYEYAVAERIGPRSLPVLRRWRTTDTDATTRRFELRGDAAPITVDPDERTYGGDRAIARGHDRQTASDDPLDDEITGLVGVTDVALDDDETVMVRPDELPPGRLRDLVDDGASIGARSARERRIVERRLDPGDELTVVGRLFDESPHHADETVLANDRGSTFFLTEAAPSIVLRRTLAASVALGIGGLAALLGGGWLVVVGIGLA